MRKLIVIISVLMSHALWGQSVTVDGLGFRGSLIVDGEVQGHYLMKVGAKKKEPSVLYIYDKDLSLVKESVIDLAKDEHPGGLVFNGKTLMLHCYNYKKEQHSYYRYSIEGELIQQDEIKWRKKEKDAVLRYYYHNVFAVANKGFIHYRPSSWGNFVIDFFDNNSSGILWSYTEESKKKLAGQHLYADKNIILFSLTELKKLFSTSDENMRTYLVGLNPANGEVLFKTRLADKTHEVEALVAHVSEDRSEIRVIGPLTEEKKRFLEGAPLGVGIVTLDFSGTIKSIKRFTWKDDFAVFFNANFSGKKAKSKAGSILKTQVTGIIPPVGGYMSFHHFWESPSGQFFAVAEECEIFHKKMYDRSSLGESYNVLGVTVRNMYIFQFSAAMELVNVELIKKSEVSRVSSKDTGLPAQHNSGYMLRRWGGYSYNFMEKEPSTDQFSVYYKNGASLMMSTYNEGQFKVKKLGSGEEATGILAIPAKPGYTAIYSWNIKKAVVTLSLKEIGE